MSKKKQQPITPLEMQQATEEIMRELGCNIHAALKTYFPNSGFALVVFPVNEPGNCNYISNVTLDSMTTVLKELVKKNPVGDIKAEKTGLA